MYGNVYFCYYMRKCLFLPLHLNEILWLLLSSMKIQFSFTLPYFRHFCNIYFPSNKNNQTQLFGRNHVVIIKSLELQQLYRMQYHEFFISAKYEVYHFIFELIQLANFARIEKICCYYDPINEQIPYECNGIKFEISFLPYWITSNFIIFFLFT